MTLNKSLNLTKYIIFLLSILYSNVKVTECQGYPDRIDPVRKFVNSKKPQSFDYINPFNRDIIFFESKDPELQLHIINMRNNEVMQLELENSHKRRLKYRWLKGYLMVFDESIDEYYFYSEIKIVKKITMPHSFKWLIVNEYYPEYSVLYTSNNKLNSVVAKSFGKNQVQLPKGSTQMSWINNSKILVYKLPDKTVVNRLVVQDFSRGTNPVHIDIPYVIDFGTFDKYVYINTKKTDEDLSEFLLHDTSSISTVHINIPVPYNRLKFVNGFYDNNYFFLLVLNNNIHCILRGRLNERNFSEILCHLDPPNGDSVPFAFSIRPNVLYANMLEYKTPFYGTIMSSDNGDTWKSVFAYYLPLDKVYYKFNLKLTLPYAVERQTSRYSRAVDTLFATNAYKNSYFNSIVNEDGNILLLHDDVELIHALKGGHALVTRIKGTGHKLEFYLKTGTLYYKLNIESEQIPDISQRHIYETEDHLFILFYSIGRFVFLKYDISQIFGELVLILATRCPIIGIQEISSKCEKGITRSCSKHTSETNCILPINYISCEDKGKCACFFESLYCKRDYIESNGSCNKMRSLYNNAMNRECKTAKININDFKAFRTILSDRCELDYYNDREFEFDNNLCPYLSDPNFLAVVTNNKIITVYLTQRGKHFAKSIFHESNILETISIPARAVYNFKSNEIYSYSDSAIMRITNGLPQTENTKIEELYRHSSEITGIIFDYLSGSLIISDNEQITYQYFLETKCTKVLQINGNIIYFHENRRKIVFITVTQQLCSAGFDMNKVCIQLKEPFEWGYFDEKTTFSFIFYPNNSIIIQKGMSNFEFIEQISRVLFVTKIDSSLYYVSDQYLHFINVLFPGVRHRILHIGSESVSNIFTNVFKALEDECYQLKCKYVCQVDEMLEAKCINPMKFDENENRIMIESKEIETLCSEHICFFPNFCEKNDKSMPKNKDNEESNKITCDHFCKYFEYLSNNTCTPKTLSCDVEDSSITNHWKRIGIIFAAVVTVIVFLALLCYVIRRILINRSRLSNIAKTIQMKHRRA